MRGSTRLLILAAVVAAVIGVCGTVLHAQAQPPAPAAGQSADLSLVGVIVRGDGQTLAVIEDRRAKRQRLYRVGETVGGGRVARIEPDRVVMTFDDREVELRLAGAPSPDATAAPPGSSGPMVAIPPTSDPATVPPVEPSNPLPRLERARITPMLLGTELLNEVLPALSGEGIRVRDVKNGGFFQAVGVRRGDVIRTVNGQVVTAASLHGLVQQAAEVGMIRLEIWRGAEVDMKYFHVGP